MYTTFKKYFIIISIVIIFILCLTYCIIIINSKNVFSILVDNQKFKEKNENDSIYDNYKLLNFVGNILERVIFGVYKVFFLSMCYIYAYKEKKYLKTIVYTCCSSLIFVVVASLFAVLFSEKIGYMNFLFPSIVNLVEGLIITLAIVGLTYLHNKMKNGRDNI